MESVIKLAIQACIFHVLIRYLIIMRMHSTLVKLNSLGALISLHVGFHTMGTRSGLFLLRTTLLGVPLMSPF